MVNLEGDTPVVEVVAPTSDVKVAEPTTPKVAPTVRTYTQKELDEAVGKGLASIQQQLSLSQAEKRTLQAEKAERDATSAAREAHIQALQREVDEVLVDDPERRKAYVDRIARLEKEQELAKDKATLEREKLDVAREKNDLRLARKARELIEQTGVPLSELEGSTTEEQMELKALKFQLNNKPEEEKETPKFDSARSSGIGDSSAGMTPRELIARGLKTGK